MNWKNELKNCLAEYSKLKKSVNTVSHRIDEIDKILYGYSERTKSNPAHQKDPSMNMQAERKILSANLQRAKSIIKAVDTALSQLDETQILILNEMFINRRPDWESRLNSGINYQRRAIYLAADKALRDFGTAYYLLPSDYI